VKFPGAVFSLIVGFVLASAVTSPAFADDEVAATEPSYLFVFDGQDAQLRPVGGKADTFELTVPTRGRGHLVTWFTDRPVRDVGHTTMKNFVGLWQQDGDDSFAENPPNVAISFNQRTLIATMAEPKLIRTRKGGQALRSTMTLVKGEALTKLLQENENLAAQVKRASSNTIRGTRRLPAVSVFVDSVQSPYSNSSSHNDDPIPDSSGDERDDDHEQPPDEGDTTNS